jgi:hypothetical protein
MMKGSSGTGHWRLLRVLKSPNLGFNKNRAKNAFQQERPKVPENADYAERKGFNPEKLAPPPTLLWTFQKENVSPLFTVNGSPSTPDDLSRPSQ